MANNNKRKRGIDEILNETLPEKSKELYNKRWLDFMEYMGDPPHRPMENDYLQYFDYLHGEKKQQASSLWSVYSSLNSIHQREFAEKLQTFPRITQLLKSYNNTYERKVAKVCESHDINQFFHMELNTAYWIVRKAVVAVALCGGLRCAEVRDITFSDVAQKGDEYEISIVRKKQRGEKKKSTFIVPLPFSSHLTTFFFETCFFIVV
jgi:site-specific recombinase XerD